MLSVRIERDPKAQQILAYQDDLGIIAAGNTPQEAMAEMQVLVDDLLSFCEEQGDLVEYLKSRGVEATSRHDIQLQAAA